MQNDLTKEILSNQNVTGREFWKNMLSGNFEQSKFPYSYDEEGKGIKSGSYEFAIDSSLYDQLMKLSNSSDYNLYLILLTTVISLLKKCTSNNDIIIVTPIFKKYKDENYINTILLLRNVIKEKITFKELLVQVKNVTSEAIEHSNYPIQTLAGQMGIVDDRGQYNITDVGLILDNIQNQGFTNDLKVNIIFCFENMKGVLKGIIKYNKGFYSEEIIHTIADSFRLLVKLFLDSPDIVIDTVDFVSEAEKKKIISQFNDTEACYDEGITFQDQFLLQVKRNPSKTALIFQDERLTYLQLNQRADQIAYALRKKGIRDESIVAITAEPSLELIEGMLGILKAGAAFLPIDVSLPEERLKYMLKDCGVELVLNNADVFQLAGVEAEVIDLRDKNFYMYEKGKPEIIITPDNLAYIIYTSGTTGVPKGVMLENKGLVNYTNWLIKEAGLGNEDKTVLTSSFAYDLGYTSVFSALAGGCELHIIKKEQYMNPRELIRYIKKYGITYLKMSPSLFGTIVNDQTDLDSSLGENLKLVLLGGEPVKIKDIKKFNVSNPKIKIMNHYGPTEATIGAVAQEIEFSSIEQYKKNIAIGRPIDNVKIYIANDALKLMPIGIPGEIIISGKGVARGYIHNEKLTRTRFLFNVFSGGDMERIYRTGDIGRFLSDGNIEFLGRKDNQVKIRGYRIEIEEIEKQLIQHENIKESAVTVGEDQMGTKFLCAYIVSDKKLVQSDIREFLRKRIPEYMVPSIIMFLDEMPLMPNGKVNKKFLSNYKDFLETNEYEKPRNKTEEEVCIIWSRILGVESIGINDNFFELGGNSINVIGIVSQLQLLDRKIKINDIYKYQTIKALCENILKTKEGSLINDMETAKIFIKKELGISCSIIKYEVSEKEIVIMFVYDLASADIDKLEFCLRGKINPDIQPHYLIEAKENIEKYGYQKRISEKQLSNMLGMKKISTEEGQKVAKSIQDMNIQMTKELLSGRCVKTYPISQTQKLRVHNQEITGSILSFHRILDRIALLKAINTFICFQPLMRSVLDSSERGYYWKEYEKREGLDIPFVDLSMYDIFFGEDFLKNFIKDFFYKWQSTEGTLCYKMLLIKLNNKDFILLIPFLHIIYDRVSREIVEREITKIYHIYEKDIEADFDKKITGYDNYVAQLNKGPVGIGMNDILERFQLDTFSEYQKKMKTVITQNYNTSESMDIAYAMKINRMDMAWGITFALFIAFCRSFFFVDKIPIFILHHGRIVENTRYLDTIGEFTNYLPVLLDGWQADYTGYQKKVQSIIRLAENNNINFASLAETVPEIENYARELFGNYITIFNFQGVYEFEGINENEKMLFDYGRKIEKENRNIINFTARCTKNEIQFLINLPFRLDESAIEGFLAQELKVNSNEKNIRRIY